MGTALSVDRGKTGEEDSSAGVSMAILERVLSTSLSGVAEVEYRLGDVRTSFNGAVLQSLWLTPAERVTGRLGSDGTTSGFERSHDSLAGVLFGFPMSASGAPALGEAQLAARSAKPPLNQGRELDWPAAFPLSSALPGAPGSARSSR